MTLISALHNLSKSVGCALLALTSGKTLVLFFVGGEMLFFLAWKILRKDFWYWPKLGGLLAILLALISRIVAKTIVDFSGCVFFRHPNELGGAALSMSMVWAQVRTPTGAREEQAAAEPRIKSKQKDRSSEINNLKLLIFLSLVSFLLDPRLAGSCVRFSSFRLCLLWPCNFMDGWMAKGARSAKRQSGFSCSVV